MIDKYKIVWTVKAKEDLQRIYMYIRYYLKEKNIAKNITQKLFSEIYRLSYFPEKYEKMKNFNNKLNV